MIKLFFLIIKMAHEVNNNGYYDEFLNFTINHCLVRDIDLNENYSNDILYEDICNILKKDEYSQDKSLLKTVFYKKKLLFSVKGFY
jgi:hypothetical protein